MKTKYIINKNEMIISLDCFYELKESLNNFNNIRTCINNIIEENNINFFGNKIIIYKNGLLIGTFFLTNYYLKKVNSYSKNKYLTPENSYFYETTITEMSPKRKKQN